jgi:hypothetical protein
MFSEIVRENWRKGQMAKVYNVPFDRRALIKNTSPQWGVEREPPTPFLTLDYRALDGFMDRETQGWSEEMRTKGYQLVCSVLQVLGIA